MYHTRRLGMSRIYVLQCVRFNASTTLEQDVHRVLRNYSHLSIHARTYVDR